MYVCASERVQLLLSTPVTQLTSKPLSNISLLHLAVSECITVYNYIIPFST